MGTVTDTQWVEATHARASRIRAATRGRGGVARRALGTLTPTTFEVVALSEHEPALIAGA